MFVIYIFLFIIFLVFILGAGIIGSIVRFIFSGFKSPSPSRQQQNRADSSSHQQQRNTWYGESKPSKKVFDKEDGEYVDFEEIKEK